MKKPTRVRLMLELALKGIWEFPDDVDDATVIEVIKEDMLGFYEDATPDWKVERE